MFFQSSATLIMALLAFASVSHATENNSRISKRQINPCLPNPCGTSGTCIYRSNKPISTTGNINPYCICSNGFTGGTNCVGATVAPTNPTQAVCPTSYCLNGGTCSVINNSLFCYCVAGFSGNLCQVSGGTTAVTTATTPGAITFTTASSAATTPPNLGRCSNLDNLCSNGGLCYYNAAGTGIFCQCPPTYTGTFCNNRALFCSTVTCLNGGTCFNNNDGTLNGFCLCPASTITGTYCEVQQPCSASVYNPCRNLGNSTGNQCIQVYNNAYCFCTSRYTGVYCENPI